MVDVVLQGLTAFVSLASLCIAVGAYRRSGPRLKVRAQHHGWVGGDEDPSFARSIAVVVWNRGDAPVTIEHWGFEYCNRFRLRPGWPFGTRGGLGMYSVDKRKGTVPHVLESGGPSAVFATPLSEIRKYVGPPTRLRAYVIVGHTPRRIRDIRTISVDDFALVREVPDGKSLLRRLLRR
jgi:hypothetical protein